MIKNYTKLLILSLMLFSATLSAQNYIDVVKDELKKESIVGADIQELEILDEVYTKVTGVTQVYLSQQYNGIAISNAQVTATFKDGDLVYVAHSLEKNIASRITATTPDLSPTIAANKAAIALNLGQANFSIVDVISAQKMILSKGGVSQQNVPISLVYTLNDADELRLAWDMSIYTKDSKHWWSVRVDATSGNIINRNDWVVSCAFENHTHNKKSKKSVGSFAETFDNQLKSSVSAPFAGETYKVYPVPVESPNHGSVSLVFEPQNAVASPFGWHDTDGVEGAEFTVTRGNNVLAQDDIAGDNEPGYLPDGGAELVFDFDYSFDSQPVNSLDAAITNLFYWNNIVHDVLFQYGFDEQSGNFQEKNYSDLGAGGDYVIADAQDGSGLNNANFSTPPEGSNPRMQMFLFNSSLPEPVTITNGSLAGTYVGVPAGFGAPLPEDTPIEGNIVIALDDNSGESSDELDACDNITNAAEISSNIAILRRGTCQFGNKVLAAENAGAIAVIVVNNDGDLIAMGPGDVGDQVTIPALMMSQVDGEAIISAIQNGENVNVSILVNEIISIDGDLDNGIIVHEYGHGVSNRLTGGSGNSNCMTTCAQPDGMGGCAAGGATEVMSEGWSDYFALMLTMEEGDSGEDVRGIGTFAVDQPTDGRGIRPTPYSTNRSINNATYDSVAVYENTTAPHPVGYVWATMLWDMTWALIDEFGYDKDLYNGTGGNNIALQLVIDGLKLQNCNPGFIDGRDAILAALEINPYLTTTALKRAAGCRVYTAFAERGLGFSAIQGDWREREDGISATDFPEGNANFCNELSVAGINVANFSVYPNPSNGTMNLRINKPVGTGTVKIFDINGRLVHTQKSVLEGNVRVEASNLSTGVYLLQVQSEMATETIKLIIE